MRKKLRIVLLVIGAAWFLTGSYQFESAAFMLLLVFDWQQ